MLDRYVRTEDITLEDCFVRNVVRNQYLHAVVRLFSTLLSM
jgi:hypothetical protein